MKALKLILLSVVGVCTGQLLLKYGLNNISVDIQLNNLVPFFMQALTSPFIICGLLAFFLSSILWLVILSKVDVSFAYPLLAIGYIVIAIASWLLLGEELGLGRIIGIFVICCGVFLMSKTGK